SVAVAVRTDDLAPGCIGKDSRCSLVGTKRMFGQHGRFRWRHGVSARHHDLRGSDTFGEGRQHGGATMAVTGSVRELPSLEHAAQVAQQLRVDGIRASTKAGSGHPTSSMSAADLVAVYATRHLRYDFGNPRAP